MQFNTLEKLLAVFIVAMILASLAILFVPNLFLHMV